VDAGVFDREGVGAVGNREIGFGDGEDAAGGGVGWLIFGMGREGPDEAGGGCEGIGADGTVQWAVLAIAAEGVVGEREDGDGTIVGNEGELEHGLADAVGVEIGEAEVEGQVVDDDEFAFGMRIEEAGDGIVVFVEDEAAATFAGMLEALEEVDEIEIGAEGFEARDGVGVEVVFDGEEEGGGGSGGWKSDRATVRWSDS